MFHSTGPVCGRALFVAIVLAIFVGAPPVYATCSEQDHVAIFVFDDLWPAFDPQVSVLAVTPVGPAIYPDAEQIGYNLSQFFGDGPGVSPGEVAGSMWSWWGVQQSAQAMVDRRDGAILFAGTMAWMGNGQLLRPTISTHEWQVVPGDPASEPVSAVTIANEYWDGFEPTSSQLTAAAISYLRTTDVIHSFAECGDYRAVGWIYTPSVGGTDASVAKLIIAVEGRVGAPWNGQDVAVEQTSWGSLKVRYR